MAGENASAEVPELRDFRFEERGDSLVGKIAAEIARGIVDGSLPPGSDLNSVDLASRFGTSRTPVREALMLLEKEGLVEIPPRRRPRVARMSLREIEEIYEIRAALNALMISLFVANAEEADLREARAVLGRMRAAALAGETETFFAERVRLHDLWMERCGNATLHKTLVAWLARMSLRRLGLSRPEHIERSLMDHERLAIACEERDANLAVALMRSMALSGLEAIRAAGLPGLEGEPGPRRGRGRSDS
jgi:DNA-binding GntR family transcriptional regulator